MIRAADSADKSPVSCAESSVNDGDAFPQIVLTASIAALESGPTRPESSTGSVAKEENSSSAKAVDEANVESAIAKRSPATVAGFTGFSVTLADSDAGVSESFFISVSGLDSTFFSFGGVR